MAEATLVLRGGLTLHTGYTVHTGPLQENFGHGNILGAQKQLNKYFRIMDGRSALDIFRNKSLTDQTAP